MDSSGTRYYVTDGATPASPVLSDGAAVYTPGLSERRSGASKFYHADTLGSTRGITDAGQNVTDTQAYDAFGNTVNRTGNTPTPFGFVGAAQYQTDGDNGLHLLGHRYYDPSVGRFLSSDPIQAGTNWYAYCDNNPLTGIDPSGLDKTRTFNGVTYILDDNGMIIGVVPTGGGQNPGSGQQGGKLPDPPAVPKVPDPSVTVPIDGGGKVQVGYDPKKNRGGVSGKFPIRRKRDPAIQVGVGVVGGRGGTEIGGGFVVRWGPPPPIIKDPMDPGRF